MIESGKACRRGEATLNAYAGCTKEAIDLFEPHVDQVKFRWQSYRTGRL